jgi:5'-nucleotidase
MKQHPLRAGLAGLVLLGGVTASLPANALNILLCNDDGLSAANLRALQLKLSDAGHQVLVAAPADNQSGRGGYIAFLQPVPPLTGNERAAKALGLAAGMPGVGQDPLDSNAHFVNGTPVAACLYGIDVLAPSKWGAAPDLLISGPNEGNNTGHINASSGTFNNLLYAINRGLPAMAVSDAATAQVNWTATLAPTSRSFEVADIVVRLIDEVLDAKPRHRGSRAHAGMALMPKGMGLNVNIPAFGAGAGPTLPFIATHIGVATAYAPAFYARLSDSAIAAASGVNVPQPGISLGSGGMVLPSGAVIPLDADPTSEGNAVAKGTSVTISGVQGAPEPDREGEAWLSGKLRRSSGSR